MAMGDTQRSYNDKQQKRFDPTYYSRLRFHNEDDTMNMSFTFWRGLLKIILNKQNPDFTTGDELGTINLSPMKANIIANYMKEVLESDTDIIKGTPTGVSETMGMIAVGRQSGKLFIFIGKVSPEGKYLENNTFIFKTNYTYGINITDISDLAYTKEYFNNYEFEQLMVMLNEFVKFANGAAGAMIADSNRYENSKLNNLVYKIADNMGLVEKKNSGNGENSFFNRGGNESRQNNSKSSYSSNNLDDLDDELT